MMKIPLEEFGLAPRRVREPSEQARLVEQVVVKLAANVSTNSTCRLEQHSRRKVQGQGASRTPRDEFKALAGAAAEVDGSSLDASGLEPSRDVLGQRHLDPELVRTDHIVGVVGRDRVEVRPLIEA